MIILSTGPPSQPETGTPARPGRSGRRRALIRTTLAVLAAASWCALGVAARTPPAPAGPGIARSAASPYAKFCFNNPDLCAAPTAPEHHRAGPTATRGR
jgi:hypothetical protein